MPESWPPVPIATRRLHLIEGDERREVLIRVWPPVPWEEDSVCDFAIDGLPQPVRLHAAGVDSLGALENVFRAIRTILDPYRERLIFLDEVGFHGIGMLIDGFDATEQRYLEGLVERETEHSLAILNRRRDRRKAEWAEANGLKPLHDLQTASFDELMALVHDAARRERACEEAEDYAGFELFLERRHEILKTLRERGESPRATQSFLAGDEPILLKLALFVSHEADVSEPLERLRRLDPDAAAEVEQLRVRVRGTTPRLKPWDVVPR